MVIHMVDYLVENLTHSVKTGGCSGDPHGGLHGNPHGGSPGNPHGGRAVLSP